MDDPSRTTNDVTGAGEKVDAAMRHHLARTDPATGLANRLVLVELLRGMAMPPQPCEMVGGVLIAVDDLVLDPTPSRHGERASMLAALGAFVAESAPEGSIAAAVADGLVLLILPESEAPRIKAAAARLRALWMRRAWPHRRIARPRVSIRAMDVPTAATANGWFDGLLAESRRQVGRRLA